MNQPMGCRQAVTRLWEYLDGALDPHDHAALDAHLAWCLRCCGELEFARELRGLLRDRATPSMSAEVAVRLDRFVDQLDAP